MADAKTDKKDDAAPKKKGGAIKLIVMGAGVLVLLGGGVGAGLYAAGGIGKHAAPDNRPRLLPKSEQPKPKEEAGKGEGDAPAAAAGALATPEGQGGDQYASTYYSFDKDFTANLQDSAHFVQVGLAVSTPYDAKVVEHLKTNDIAIRSAVLMALGDTTEEQVMTSPGKRQLQDRLVKAINATLQQKEGFGGVSNVYFTNFVVQ